MNRCNYEGYDAFISKDEHRHGNPVTSLEYTQIKGTVIRVAAHEQKKASINMLFLIKMPKRNNLRVLRIRENPVITFS